MAGAWITLAGAVITIIINYLFIPRFSYMACAWATFTCYGSMMVISFVWGQKNYRIPYAWKKLVAYIVIAILLFFVHNAITRFTDNIIVNFIAGAALLAMYLWFIGNVEKKELPQLPLIGKYFKK